MLWLVNEAQFDFPRQLKGFIRDYTAYADRDHNEPLVFSLYVQNREVCYSTGQGYFTLRGSRWLLGWLVVASAAS